MYVCVCTHITSHVHEYTYVVGECTYIRTCVYFICVCICMYKYVPNHFIPEGNLPAVFCMLHAFPGTVDKYNSHLFIW